MRLIAFGYGYFSIDLGGFSRFIGRSTAALLSILDYNVLIGFASSGLSVYVDCGVFS